MPVMHNSPDYGALFDASPYPYLLIDPDLLIIGANQAYLKATGRTADIIGLPIFEAFPADPSDPESTNLAQVAASIEHALRTGRPHTVAFLRYAIPHQAPGGIVFEERFWSAVHTPVLSADGSVMFVAQNAIDVTDLYTLDPVAGIAQVDGTPRQIQQPEVLDRAQMHEAMKRILNDERSHLSNLFNQAPSFIAVMSGNQHVFEMVNEAYYQLVGHRDIIGRPVFEALPEMEGQGFRQLLDQVFSTGEAVVARGIKAQVQRFADGPLSDRYIDLVYQPLFSGDGKVSGIFAQGHDVTEAHDAQQALRDADERLREGMLVARMVIWDMDLASGDVKFSDNALAIFGGDWHTAQEVWASLHPEDMPKLHAAREAAITCRGEYQQNVRLIRPSDQSIMWLQVKGRVRCDQNGVAVSVRGVSLDITERMKAEQDLREADRRKDEFLAMLAHELRNPLAPISAAAQLLKMPGLKPELINKTSGIIGRQVGHMTSLIDDLLDVSRVTRGLIVLERKRLEIMAVVTDAIEQVRPIINARRQDLSVRVPPGAIELIGDQKRLVQVLTNLLNNAAKYTAEGGSLELSVATTPTMVSVGVRDNGIGIPANLLPHVFDLFTQAERTPDRSQGGLGLGLALVRSLVALHGGSVAASSAGKGHGATFTVDLPRIIDAPVHDGRTADPAAVPRRDKQLRLLVVDDNADAAEMLGAFMESVGHEVTIEHDPYRAIEHALARPPDACLLDIGLPGMDGNQLARLLRSMPEMSDTVLIAVTGYGKKFDHDTAIAAGFDHYFVKPADPMAVLALLDRLHEN